MIPYLTKSRFMLGWECETKLFYSAHPDKYANAKTEDPFMQSLAEGGFQVGELARVRLCQDPQNDVISTLNYNDAFNETILRLKSENVSIAEAAFLFDKFFIRADIVIKKNKTLELYEVKSAAWTKENKFWQERNPDKPNTNWLPYLLDVAFQKYVIQKVCKNLEIKAFLVLLNKDAPATVDGLNQMFKVTRDKRGNYIIKTPKITKEALGEDIFAYINVDEDINKIFKMHFPVTGANFEKNFEEMIYYLADICSGKKKVFGGVGRKCKYCEFILSSDPQKQYEEIKNNFKSGKEECWKEILKDKYSREKPTILELWNNRHIEEHIANNKYYIEDLQRNDIADGKIARRQWLQIEKTRKSDSTPWINRYELNNEIKKWRFPLHFIDFETSRVAIPFNKDRHPYEQIAFQFSHHKIEQNGRVIHAGQWIEERAGIFPNFNFTRALKKELSQDEGTIFCYAPHEKIVLSEIYNQLKNSQEEDRYQLCRFIENILPSKNSCGKIIEGTGRIVDMRDIIINYHYDPYTRGSNSLKTVLPAIINSSAMLKKKYGAPIYGTDAMPSMNYKGWTWIRPEKQNDPYKTLPPLSENLEEEKLSEYLENFNEIAEGGAAMTAYAKLQFFDMPQTERKKLVQGLLRYCELDTLAMVMLYQYWCEECRGNK